MCLAAALGVTKCVAIIVVNLVTLCCAALVQDVQQTEAVLSNKSSTLAAAFKICKNPWTSKNIDCLSHLCFISTVSGCSNKKKKEDAYPWKAGASSGLAGT